MSQKRLSDEQILEALKNLASSLGKDTLTKQDLSQHLQGLVGVSTINGRFGSIGDALERAGLRRPHPNETLNRVRRSAFPDDQIFGAIREVEEELGKEPTFNQFSAHASISTAPIRKRYGKWADAMRQYRQWKEDGGFQDTSTGVRTEAPSGDITASSRTEPPERSGSGVIVGRKFKGRVNQIYGAPINFRGLIHAPVNEQGVVYLFGMVSRELGFNIEAIQSGFPDCEGKVPYDKAKELWRRVFIEFEFKASNFKDHGHDPEGCDFIVCWENDWPDAPDEVIELSKEIRKLTAR